MFFEWKRKNEYFLILGNFKESKNGSRVVYVALEGKLLNIPTPFEKFSAYFSRNICSKNYICRFLIWSPNGFLPSTHFTFTLLIFPTIRCCALEIFLPHVVFITMYWISTASSIKMAKSIILVWSVALSTVHWKDEFFADSFATETKCIYFLESSKNQN